jgi:iron complex outermembrane receptor protein
MLIHLDYPVMIFPLREGNKNRAKTYGAELSADWRVKNWRRIIGSYSFLDIAIDNTDAPDDIVTKSRETQSPQNQVLLRSQFDLPRDLEFDMTWRYVDRLKSLGIPDYTTFDLRLGWRPVRNLELSLVGQNLLEDAHREYLSNDYIRTAPETIQRGVYTKLAWNW